MTEEVRMIREEKIKQKEDKYEIEVEKILKKATEYFIQNPKKVCFRMLSPILGRETCYFIEVLKKRAASEKYKYVAEYSPFATIIIWVDEESYSYHLDACAEN